MFNKLISNCDFVIHVAKVADDYQKKLQLLASDLQMLIDYLEFVKRQEIEDFCWHDLRHTWSSWHIQNGTPLHVLQELVGWSSI